MSMLISHATESQQLRAVIVANSDWDASDFVDLCSTTGSDNDGTSGAEMVDNGIGLALAAAAYDPQAKIFFTIIDDDDDDEHCYWQFGRDEQDAARRLRESFATMG